MAEIIPSLNSHTLGRMTPGERRFARRLESLLDDTYLAWYDIPVGRTRRYPDFIILHPMRGILFLEVKDWKIDTLKKITSADVELLTNKGLVTKPNPLVQARQYAYAVLDRLSQDPQLLQGPGPYRGNLIMPYGWGVVFTNITRKQIQQSIPEEDRGAILPDHLVIYKDEMTDAADSEEFQEQLWNMFNYNFGRVLTLPQIDRIRWHLFPEIRIDAPEQADLFGPDDSDAQPIEQTLPDIVKIMDIQQEQLARSLGEGHRVIHGVAGSGKTMILGYRCLYLAQLMQKPILVLCFNVTLAAKLRAFISSKGIGGQVQVFHFHDWCAQQLKTYHVSVPASDRPYFERQVETVIDAVEQGLIPRAQYGALLIDEGHDFEADWLKLVVQMVDPETNSLLLLYDDAQTIYRKQAGLGFSLSSVGVEARGRTTILRLNYRNTREILAFAYEFVSHYLDPQRETEDGMLFVEPEAAGKTGQAPAVRRFNNLEEEIRFARACVAAWHRQGVAWRDMAIIFAGRGQGSAIANQLRSEDIPCVWLGSKDYKSRYDPTIDQVTILTVYSSKGLEFPRVILVGVGQLDDDEEKLAQDARLLYVGMTRAQEYLLITTSADNEYSRRFCSVA